MGKKNFVLDTNVLLHDHKCIFNFEENDIFIPIVVLEELDKFKKGNEELRDKVQDTLDEMVKDGTFAEIAEKWGLTDSVCLGK